MHMSGTCSTTLQWMFTFELILILFGRERYILIQVTHTMILQQKIPRLTGYTLYFMSYF